jgi:hypothetical protein
MTTATGVRERIPEDYLGSTLEWESVVKGRCNLLLEGPKEWTEALLWNLAPQLEAPVIWATSRGLRRLPGRCCTLVLQDVAALGRLDQQLLHDWLDDGRQVISTTMHPLFPLVVRGCFDEALYYRLNVVRLHDASAVAVL